MASLNQGQQKILWKYETPLKGAELAYGNPWQNLPGLVTRPRISSDGVFEPFSVWVRPLSVRDFKPYYNEQGGEEHPGMVKITFTESFKPSGLNITSNTCALGLKFTFRPNGLDELTANYFADIESVTLGNVENYEGVILATVTHTASGNVMTTAGADISTELLLREGFNPLCWPSLESPRRMFTNHHYDGNTNEVDYSYIEYRCGNDVVSHKTGNKKVGIIDLPETFFDYRSLVTGTGYIGFGLTEQGIVKAFNTDQSAIRLSYVDGTCAVATDLAKNNILIRPMTNTFPTGVDMSYNETKRFVVFS